MVSIIPAQPPQPPAHCAVTNQVPALSVPQDQRLTAVPMLQTTELLQVECLPGFDGGLDQVAANQPSQSFTVPGEGPSDQTAHLI